MPCHVVYTGAAFSHKHQQTSSKHQSTPTAINKTSKNIREPQRSQSKHFPSLTSSTSTPFILKNSISFSTKHSIKHLLTRHLSYTSPGSTVDTWGLQNQNQEEEDFRTWAWGLMVMSLRPSVRSDTELIWRRVINDRHWWDSLNKYLNSFHRMRMCTDQTLNQYFLTVTEDRSERFNSRPEAPHLDQP